MLQNVAVWDKFLSKFDRLDIVVKEREFSQMYKIDNLVKALQKKHFHFDWFLNEFCFIRFFVYRTWFHVNLCIHELLR